MFFQITDELKVNGMLITVDIQKKKKKTLVLRDMDSAKYSLNE